MFSPEMKRNLIMKCSIAAIFLSTVFSANALADEGKCVFSELSEENTETIAQSLAAKAMGELMWSNRLVPTS